MRAAFILSLSLTLTPGGAVRAAAQAHQTPVGGRTTRPTAPYTDTLTSLSAGGGTTCVTTAAGNAFCWGALGRRDGTPERILGADGRPARLRAIVTSDYTRCGLTTDGEVWCDRAVTGGFTDAAGNSDSVPKACEYYRCLMPLPTRNSDSLPKGVRDIAAGMFHACALVPNGTVYCWGVNHMGELGNGTLAPDSIGSVGPITRVPTPVIGGMRFSQVSAGEELTCALSSPEQAVYCWGYGQNGETGDSSIMTYCDGAKPFYTKPCSTPTPARVLPEAIPGDYTPPNDVKFVRVAAGMRMACAISVAGDAYCWGSNYRCELGRCRSAASARAHRIAVPGRVVEIAAGYWHACARTAERRVFCWGNNTAGQLGSLATVNAGPDGAPPDYRDTTNHRAMDTKYSAPCFNGGRCSPAPVEVSPGRRWGALALGTDHACALADDDGGIYCWGGGERMSLGRNMRLVRCENRSPEWKDEQCQPTPVRIPGLPALAAPPSRETFEEAAGRRGRERDSELRSTRVLVSAREVRVVFPPDTSRTWGWTSQDKRDQAFQYYWGVYMDGIDGPRSLQLRVGDGGTTARTFASLRALVRSEEPGLCTGGMVMQCNPSGTSASVDGNRVVLTLSAPEAITRLFGLRPDSVGVERTGPEDAWRAPVRVKVQYVSPPIPAPDAAFRAEAARARRRYEASIHWMRRSIAGGPSGSGAIWVGVGDSIPISVSEMRCTHDVCSGYSSTAPAGSVWSVDDSSVARLRHAEPKPNVFGSDAASLHLVAGARGRTTVRVRLPASAADTMPFQEPPARALERPVVVTNPASRVEISTPRDTVRLGDPLDLTVRVLDREGRAIDGAPVQVRYEDGGSAYVATSTGALRIELQRPGTRPIVASFGRLADTVLVTVK